MTEMTMATDVAMLFSNMMAACREQWRDAMSKPRSWRMRDALLAQLRGEMLDGACRSTSDMAEASCWAGALAGMMAWILAIRKRAQWDGRTDAASASD